MTVQYRHFYPGLTSDDVAAADPKRFPLRSTAPEAAADARLHWHREGEHTVPYRMEPDGTVTELTARMKRRIEVAG